MTKFLSRWCWRKDLAAFRGLSDRERSAFLVFLEWMENFRLRMDLEAGRDAAEAFWTEEVVGYDRVREDWQLEQWAAAVTWYLNWLKACEDSGADHRSIPERLRVAVQTACCRRGFIAPDEGLLRRLGSALWEVRGDGGGGDYSEDGDAFPDIFGGG